MNTLALTKYLSRSRLVSKEFLLRGTLSSLLLTMCFPAVMAQSGVVNPSANLEVTGIPPVPASLPREVQPYTGIYGLPLAGWDASKRELLLKGLSSVSWVSRVESPGATPQTTSIYIREPGIYDIYFQPQRKYLAYVRDTDGNEAFQLNFYNLESGTHTLLSDGKSRNTEPVWSNSGERIVYSSSPTGAQGTSLRLINPLDPKTDRLLAQSSGGYFKAYDWSPDDKQIVFCDFTSNTVSTLWLVDSATGAKTLLASQVTSAELYDHPQFSKDGKGLYVITDHGSDFRRLAYIDFTTKRFTYLSAQIKWDVDEFQLAPDGKTLAFTSNEDGISRLRLMDTATGKERLSPQPPVGIISDLKWHSNAIDLAFNFKSSRTPNDVYSLDIKSGKIELWSRSITNGIDTEKFSLPELIHWNTFDDHSLSGYLYRPPAKFTGKRPVVIEFHGGPEEQYRPGYGYADNYFLNELGVAIIYPNVRGSSGYGKAFLRLDNGVLRQDAVKDIGSLLEWIKTRPDLDAERVLVQGSSYGGYLALSAAVNYSDRIRGAISDSGISNLATFEERTEGWRRGLQRAEFGDERNPSIREFMERTAPLNNAQMISKPLMIIQGQNDPRVPVSEATRLVQATKNRIPVWYLLAQDEGHGFVRQNNLDYRLYATILFVKQFLLK